MPYLFLQTNSSLDDSGRAAFLSAASVLVSEQLGKSQDYFMGAVDDGLNMVFGGSTDPVALVEVAALGLSAAHSRSLAGPISSLVTQHFNVPGARIYVRFQDSERSMWAWNGNTFG